MQGFEKVPLFYTDFARLNITRIWSCSVRTDYKFTYRLGKLRQCSHTNSHWLQRKRLYALTWTGLFLLKKSTIFIFTLSFPNDIGFRTSGTMICSGVPVQGNTTRTHYKTNYNINKIILEDTHLTYYKQKSYSTNWLQLIEPWKLNIYNLLLFIYELRQMAVDCILH